MYELDNVTRTFRVGSQEVRAVDGVNLEVDRGEFVAIQGPSGSGKSTLLQLLGALDTPTEGTLRFDGRDLTKLGQGELTKVRSRDIGFIFQSFNLIPTLTAEENVEVAMIPLGLKGPTRRGRGAELLEQVGLATRAKHLPSKLSGGEQQRVAIARALANEPRVLLADEPTGNLDSQTADEVVAILRRLSQERGVTVVLVTHADEVAQRATRRLRMRDGKLLDQPAPTLS
ncbi:MAG TPA: ABC transporter ATP-binding protein [Actinomycetota bacterium]|nr:ABC transporter ATP-binding protein [Actinomycetota bacterium]